MIGPGKYDKETTELLGRLDAGLVIVMVIDGSRGNGFSLSMDASKLPPSAQLGQDVARGLRSVAEQIERDFAEI